MSISSSLLLTSLISGLITGVLYWLICLLMVRRCGSSWDVNNPDVKQRSIQYHNEAIYRDFTFFIKVTLALMGGVAYIVVFPVASPILLKKFLLIIASYFQFIMGLIFTVFVLFHQKSKIERWDKKPGMMEPLLWQEFWIVIAMMVISSDLTFVLLPELARQIV